MAIVELDPKQGQDKGNQCQEVGDAVDGGTIGKVFAKHEQLILRYYEDVQQQANKSFELARSIARIGFFVLISSLGCAILLDILNRFNVATNVTEKSLSIVTVGFIGGTIIEVTAGGAFWLYTQTAKQFWTFHVCLERTHRYLLSYKIAEKLEAKKEDTFRDLVCIMAKAPMISLAAILSPVGAGRGETGMPNEPSQITRPAQP